MGWMNKQIINPSYLILHLSFLWRFKSMDKSK